MRRGTDKEKEMAQRLERLTGEFQERTGGNDTSGLGRQLREFYYVAAQEQTAEERMNLNVQLDAWQQQLRMYFPK
ncbi:hypothetical protein D7V97_42735 [Corallococcus sp. CA053C]|nr:hypothetical protein D7V97_42735 [Corallococcus sp. CA053C]